MVERNSTKLAQKTLSIDSFIELQHEVFCFVMSYMGRGWGLLVVNFDKEGVQ